MRTSSPKQENCTSEVQEGEEILRLAFPAGVDASPTLEPREKALDFPAAFVPPHGATILLALAPAPCASSKRRNQFDVALCQLIGKGCAVVSFVPD